jgi:hypothetical protein
MAEWKDWAVPILAAAISAAVVAFLLEQRKREREANDDPTASALQDLSKFDGQRLNGLDFCRQVYALFDQIKAIPGGAERLRYRETDLEKKLLEELIPIARYIQQKYREGLRIEVQWFGGSQPYDAILHCSGTFVERDLEPSQVTVEVTTSVHKNEYLARERLGEQGFAFGNDQLARDKPSHTITSTPYVETPVTRAATLAKQIVAAIEKKAAKNYPPGAVLIVWCVLNGVTYLEEWTDAVAQVATAGAHRAFKEVFLIDTSSSSYSATLR